MRYEIEIMPEAQKEFDDLDEDQQILLLKDYNTIQNHGLEYVLTRPIEDKIFEIKTQNLRSLFIYQKDQIIIVGLIYIKETQKMPLNIKKQAIKRFKKFNK